MEITTELLSARPLQYYVHMRRWISDLEFYHTEIEFLLSLQDNYLRRVTDEPGRFKRLSRLEEKFLKLANTITPVGLRLYHQVSSLEMVAIGMVKETEEEAAVKFVHSETEMSQVRKDFRNLKKELYKVLETAMRENKMFVG